MKRPPKNSFVSKPVVVMEQETATTPSSASSAVKSFVPYSSPLTFMSTPPEPPKDDVEMKVPNYEKKKSKPAKFPKASGKLLNPLSQGVTKSKAVMKLEIQAKKQKATMARKKAQNKLPPPIELTDSDESDCIPVDLPPPPLITLDSSDEETIKKKRAMSPSTSSIVSDDFIVAGDKRRLVNPFKSDEVVSSAESRKKVSHPKATFEKVKELTKVQSSTSSSSESPRSSTEKTLAEPKVSKRNRKSLDNGNEDSIYGAKTKGSKPKPASESSDNGTPSVNAKNHRRTRRQKSASSRQKSTDPDSDEDEDPRIKLIASTPVASGSKRLRYLSSTYNDAEFATMISSIVHSGDAEPSDNEEADKAINETNTITVNESTLPAEKTCSQESDCELIEQPVEVVDVAVDSDSNDSMRGFNVPIHCDLSLNITQVPYEPHEYILNRGETSQALVPASNETVNPEVGWNDEMKFFYDGSWGDKNFCISTILNEMPQDPKLWRINNNDRYRMQDSGSRVRCKRCNEFGHPTSKCTRPKKRIVCFMCGDEGHRETRCPKSICLRVRRV